jgi:hypothetical protein
MRRHCRPLSGLVLCVQLALQACASAPQLAPGFFAVPPQEKAAVQALIREQERQVQTCAAARSCPRAHYLRGLAALYEDRAVAMKHFQAVLAAAPEGPHAASSRLWVQLLNDARSGSGGGGDLVHATERLVREVLEDEAALRQASMRVKSADAALNDAQTAHELKRQLHEREKKIDELTQQIDALKRVDQEVKERVKPRRPAN